MNALFALALLASSSWAGVVMPVESGVAPSGPSAPAVPVLAPAAGSLGAPSLGAAADLRGALPVLPAPVPGLAPPALNFVGSAQEAAAVHPEAAASVSARATATPRQGRAADQAPALPAKPSPGTSSPAIALDRASDASTPGKGLSLSRAPGDETPSNPLVDSSSLEHARPEKAAGLGRRFFDQSDESRRGALEDGAASRSVSPKRPLADGTAEGSAEGGPGYGGTQRLAARNTETAFGAGHGPSRSAVSYAPEGETLHDAVASAPGAFAAAGAARFYGSVAPNGDLAALGAAGTAVPAAPHPLALDLSRSGLIVRVRSALNGAAAPAAPAASAAKLAAPGASTVLLERGAMLEAFSVARAYADSLSAARPLTAGVLKAAPAAPPAPASEPAPVSLWWAWFALPLFAAAIRGIL
ncbi:MAG: hypothetical protein PHS14_09395 [Elusimicrobia bacterium]|nr:hypothetical protein [Elusimicrobiota bacterium]